MKKALLLAAALLVVGLSVSGVPDPRPRVTLGLMRQSADSVWIRGQWNASQDARQNNVSTYRWSYWTPAAKLLEGDTTALSVVRSFKRPLAGDTVRYYMEVIAIDVRGKPSQPGRSNVIVVGTPWTPPTTPGVTIDTLTVATLTDSLTIYRLGQRVAPYRTGQIGLSYSAIGQTDTLCALAWSGGKAYIPGFEIGWANPETPEHMGGVLAFQDLGGGCTLVTTLKATTIPDLPGAVAYYSRVAKP